MSATDGGRLPRLADVLDLGQEEIDLEPLVGLVTQTDVELGTFTDEELHWTSPEPDAAPTDVLEAPRLSAVTEVEQQAALSAVMWQLLARGDADWDGEHLRLEGVLAVVGQLRHGSEAAASVQVQTAEDGPWPRVAGLVRVRADLFLVEHVAPEGLHWLACCSADRAAARLASLVDPLQRARATGDVVHGADAVELEQQLLDGSDSSAFALLGDTEGVRRAATTYGRPDGLFVLQGDDGGEGDGAVAAQPLAPPDLVRYCAAFLSREPAAEVAAR